VVVMYGMACSLVRFDWVPTTFVRSRVESVAAAIQRGGGDSGGVATC
jgi:hypothetical protein